MFSSMRAIRADVPRFRSRSHDFHYNRNDGRCKGAAGRASLRPDDFLYFLGQDFVTQVVEDDVEFLVDHFLEIVAV